MQQGIGMFGHGGVKVYPSTMGGAVTSLQNVTELGSVKNGGNINVKVFVMSIGDVESMSLFMYKSGIQPCMGDRHGVAKNITMVEVVPRYPRGIGTCRFDDIGYLHDGVRHLERGRKRFMATSDMMFQAPGGNHFKAGGAAMWPTVESNKYATSNVKGKKFRVETISAWDHNFYA